MGLFVGTHVDWVGLKLNSHERSYTMLSQHQRLQLHAGYFLVLLTLFGRTSIRRDRVGIGGVGLFVCVSLFHLERRIVHYIEKGALFLWLSLFVALKKRAVFFVYTYK